MRRFERNPGAHRPNGEEHTRRDGPERAIIAELAPLAPVPPDAVLSPEVSAQVMREMNLLVWLVSRRRAGRPDAPLFADERYVAWLTRELREEEREEARSPRTATW